MQLYPKASEWAKCGLQFPIFVGTRNRHTLAAPPAGRIFSVVTEDPRSPLHWLALLKHEIKENIVVYSRLSPQRLGQHLNLNQIEFKWLSESIDPHSLSPSLERIHHAISTRISSDRGLIWVDGVEYLIHRQGFDAFLSFTRSLADELSGSEWTVLLPYSPLSIDATELAHLRREAIPFNIPQISDVSEEAYTEIAEIDNQIIAEDATDNMAVVVEEEKLPEEQLTLNLLSTIPQASLTPSVLSRRIQQWQDMGLDVSELHHAVNAEPDIAYQSYVAVEALVRRAVECEKRIRMIEIRGHLVEAAKMRFRILQLTGIEAVETRLDDILSGSI